MADSPGISGIAVAVTGSGLLLMMAAIRNESPADTLRSVLGMPTSGQATGTPVGSVDSGVRDIGVGVAGSRAMGGVAGVPSSAPAAHLVQAAEAYLGTPYVYGGTSKKGIDCSGLVVASLRDIGVKAPRFTTATFDSWARGYGAKRIAPADFRAGDVLRRPGHMAIARSATTMVHAPHIGTVVKDADIYSISSWWGWRLFP